MLTYLEDISVRSALVPKENSSTTSNIGGVGDTGDCYYKNDSNENMNNELHTDIRLPSESHNRDNNGLLFMSEMYPINGIRNADSISFTTTAKMNQNGSTLANKKELQNINADEENRIILVNPIWALDSIANYSVMPFI